MNDEVSLAYEPNIKASFFGVPTLFFTTAPLTEGHC